MKFNIIKMKNYKENKNFNQLFELFEDNTIDYFGRSLGKKAYGKIREIKIKNVDEMRVGILLKKESDDDKMNETMIEEEIRGNNIFPIIKVIIKKIINGEEYDLVIMEKSKLRDLGKLNEYYHKHNLLKLIGDNYKSGINNGENTSDNLLRFYAKQIIDGLEILNRSYFLHFDIKPENLLITLNLIIKISDFSLLTKNKDDIIKIPGGTQSYLTPEYYNKETISNKDARKQDYFALGSTLFYGENLLKYKKDDESKKNYDTVTQILFQKYVHIKSIQLTDQEFIDFINSLIHHDINNRSDFDEIYRNKWLNRNKEVIEDIMHGNENDEGKIIMELQKSDYLINKQKDLIHKKEKKFKYKKKEPYIQKTYKYKPDHIIKKL